MDKPSGVLIAEPRVRRPAPVPPLKLLIQWEPRHRVFLSNLVDLLLRRQPPPLRITAQPARFWPDVFVPAGASWTSFSESLLWHLLVIILFVWGQSRVWTPVKRFQQKDAFRHTITYYPLAPSFRAAESRASDVHGSARVRRPKPPVPEHQAAARESAMPVNPEQKPSLVTPPDIKEATGKLPDLATPRGAAPMAPFPTGSRQNALSGAMGVVAPPAHLDPAAPRRPMLPQTSAVAPAPELGTSSGRAIGTASAGGVRIVPPPPSVQNAGDAAGTGRLSSLPAGMHVVTPPPSVQGAGTGTRSRAIAATQVVPPPASVEGAGNSANAGRLSSLSGAGGNVVHPPPSLQGAGGDSRLHAMAGAGSLVVPPPASVEGAGGSARSGRRSSLSDAGQNVVNPPPSVQGAGGDPRLRTMGGGGSAAVPPPASVEGTGGPAGTGRVSSLSGAGPTVVPPSPPLQGTGETARAGLATGGSEPVPPPPSVHGSAGTGEGTRVGALSGAASGAVPPTPSVETASNSGGDRLGSLPGNGSQILAPAPSSERATNLGGGTARVLDPAPMISPSGAVPPPPQPSFQPESALDQSKATVEELPLGMIGLVFELPGTSFFSNFEVFVAKRKLGKEHLELIKLVYEFLPYQRRLSEYNLNNLPPRVIKLRVIPDPSCNESLGQMLELHADPNRPLTQYPKLPAALLSQDLNTVLPCYRTNADDFQKAMLHK